MSHTYPSQKDLALAIEKATRIAVRTLFREHPENFYYIALITSGEAHRPSLSAWSHEALVRTELENANNEDYERQLLKWSYADSPYCNYGDQFFSNVGELFDARPSMSDEMTSDEWREEWDLRVGAMEMAASKLDSEGLFGIGSDRKRVVVTVEVMPPDYSNTERVKRLNPREAIVEWLKEAAE